MCVVVRLVVCIFPCSLVYVVDLVSHSCILVWSVLFCLDVWPISICNIVHRVVLHDVLAYLFACLVIFVLVSWVPPCCVTVC